MTIYYRSPHSGSVAAVTAPARLALEFDEVFWREAADGAIEIAVRDGNVVRRLRVNDDGSFSELHQIALPSKQFAKALLAIGVSSLALSFVMAAAHVAEDRVFVIIGFGAVALMWVGGSPAEQVKSYWMSRIGSGWHLPTNLKDWTPRSATQLAVVESIADRHDGRAWVRDIGGTSITVRARTWLWGFNYYLVEDDGFMVNQGSDWLSTGLADRRDWIKIRTREEENDGDGG